MIVASIATAMALTLASTPADMVLRELYREI
jgi:hypothetical protein